MWVHRDQIVSPEKIDELIEFVKKSDIRTLLVQVRGRGDAFYNSKYEYAAEGVQKDFDPLKYIIDKTANTDIAVHAWVNMFYCLDKDKYPPSPDHIVAKRPEWVTFDYAGRSIIDYSEGELKEKLVEGIFNDPGIPEVREYLAKIVADILDKYNVKGIHLDYIRYPYSGHSSFYKAYLSDFGYNKISNEIFTKKYKINPFDIDRIQVSAEKTIFDDYRRANINDLVMRINKVVKSKSKQLILSAAVMPRYEIGRDVYFQDWPSWLEQGILDIACVMSYSGSVDKFEQYVNYSLKLAKNDKILLGMWVKDTVPLAVTVEQIRMTYDMGLKGFCLFSFRHTEASILNLNKKLLYEDTKLRY
jgi:uncharacterized lipoprotein YddW (UPF0748 family)